MGAFGHRVTARLTTNKHRGWARRSHPGPTPGALLGRDRVGQMLVVDAIGGRGCGNDFLHRCQRVPVGDQEPQVVGTGDVVRPRGGRSVAPGVLGCAGLCTTEQCPAVAQRHG